jgi:hypothetical protein
LGANLSSDCFSVPWMSPLSSRTRLKGTIAAMRTAAPMRNGSQPSMPIQAISAGPAAKLAASTLA